MQPIRRVDKPVGASTVAPGGCAVAYPPYTGCLGGDPYLIVAEPGG